MDNPLKNKDLTNKVLNSTYKLIRRLGMGAFGEIYLAVNKSKEEFAIKLERADTQYPQILYEAKVYSFLHADQIHDRGIPKVYGAATEGEYNYLVMDLLGSSLEDLFTQCNKKFSLKSVLMLAEQMVTRIELMHSRSFIHRDIKPDNFLMGIGKQQSKLYVVDMGLAKRYFTKDGHIPYKENKALTGTARYASINTHLGYEQSRRDDLEGMAYVLVYLVKGTLPWMNLKSYNQNDKYEKIKEKKISTTSQVLCKGLPQEMAIYLDYVKKLRFDEKPNYDMIRGLFRNAFQQLNYTLDYIYDWSKNVPPKPESSEMEAINKIKQELAKEQKQQINKHTPTIKQNSPDMKLQTQQLKKQMSPRDQQKRVQSAQKIQDKRGGKPLITKQQTKPLIVPKVQAPRIVINKEPYTKY